MAYIYALSDPNIKDIRYIGQTINLKKRYNAHISDAGHKISYVNRWIKTLLDNNNKPWMDIIHECSDDNIDLMEIYYIEYYKKLGCKLTNLRKGGKDGYNHTKETIDKIRKSLSTKLTFYSINISTKEVLKHESFLELMIKFGFDRNDRKRAMRCYKSNDKRYTSVKGFLFVPVDCLSSKTIEEIIKEKMPENARKFVLQYSTDGKFIKEYTSINDAAISTQTTSEWIVTCCNNENKTIKNHIWTWKENNKIPKAIQPTMVTHNKIARCDISSGDILEIYDSQSDASSRTGINIYSISKCINAKRQTGGGYRWKIIS